MPIPMSIPIRALREMYKIAGQLASFFQMAAHPADLMSHDLYVTGARKFVDGEYSEEDLLGYARGENAMIACLAVEAIKRKFDEPNTRTRLVYALGSMDHAPYYVTLQYLSEAVPHDTALAGPAIIESSDQLWNDTIKDHLEALVRARVAGGEELTFGDHLPRLNENYAYEVEQFVNGLSGLDTSVLKEELGSRSSSSADPAFLKSVGKVWDAHTLAATDAIIEHHTLIPLLDRLEAAFEASPAKSSLIVGETGVGKSSAISKLATRLNAKGWTVFMAGHQELVAGQMYIGQFEERLKQLIDYLVSAEKVLWFIPAFDRLAVSGRHKYSPASALDTVLPYVESGEIKIIGEVTRNAYERLAQSDTRVPNAFSIIRIEPLPAADTLDLAGEWLKQECGKRNEKTLKEAWHLAQHYLSETASPGNLLKLLKLTKQRLGRGKPPNTKIPIAPEHLLATLIELTGLSEVMLDDDAQLDLDELRSHFHKRVIGQDEAISCLVERIAMIKAGVTDPTRPSGVFLFAGPTGTGKTEIAKALSEWLFGSPDRMIRLDMSELQTPESLDRLIGADEGGGGALTDQIHEQPFSVVLLDEFEKAHPNVWDLFLQVFDDGRLTDRQGRTADFRHAIVILTSNLGAAIPTDTPMGFAGTKAGFDPALVHAELEKVFRREFVNRLDQVVVFRPLSRDVMRNILQKELDLAFQRRGLRSRSWAVEWDEAAIDFLLDPGFHPRPWRATAQAGHRPATPRAAGADHRQSPGAGGRPVPVRHPQGGSPGGGIRRPGRGRPNRCLETPRRRGRCGCGRRPDPACDHAARRGRLGRVRTPLRPDRPPAGSALVRRLAARQGNRHFVSGDARLLAVARPVSHSRPGRTYRPHRGGGETGRIIATSDRRTECQARQLSFADHHHRRAKPLPHRNRLRRSQAGQASGSLRDGRGVAAACGPGRGGVRFRGCASSRCISTGRRTGACITGSSKTGPTAPTVRSDSSWR